MVRQIKDFGQAKVEDYIDPCGGIMAGGPMPFWKKAKEFRR